MKRPPPPPIKKTRKVFLLLGCNFISTALLRGRALAPALALTPRSCCCFALAPALADAPAFAFAPALSFALTML